MPFKKVKIDEFSDEEIKKMFSDDILDQLIADLGFVPATEPNNLNTFNDLIMKHSNKLQNIGQVIKSNVKVNVKSSKASFNSNQNIVMPTITRYALPKVSFKTLSTSVHIYPKIKPLEKSTGEMASNKTSEFGAKGAAA